MRSLAVIALLSIASYFQATDVSHSASYPSTTITIIVPFAPGGSGDIIARKIGDTLSKRLGQTVVIESRPGAAGAIGTRAVAHAKPDGYTLLFHSNSVTVQQNLEKNPLVDITKDLEPIAPGVFVKTAIVVNSELPVKNLSELISYAKENPGKVLFGSSGVGSIQHLDGEVFKSITGVTMTHVPYGGGGPVVLAAVANQVQLLFISTAIVRTQLQEGSLRALAVASRERDDRIPDVPTSIESGLDNYTANNWFGFFAPKGTPAEVVEKLNREISDILSQKEFAENLKKDGYDVNVMSSSEFKDMVLRDTKKWGDVIDRVGIAKN